jgi:GNAT superfamily N-acetyltransferase
MNSFTRSLPVLVESLFDDPFYQAISIDFSEDPGTRKHVLGAYFEYSLGEAERTGRCVIDSEPDLGAAAWLLPRTPGVEATEAMAKTTYLSRLLGPRGNENYHRMVRFMAPLAEAVVPADAWYLSIVGVLPAAQGKGVGARLLKPTLDEVQDAGVSCYLETFSPHNPAFYERMGFRQVAIHREPTTDAEYMIMRRDASPEFPA